MVLRRLLVSLGFTALHAVVSLVFLVFCIAACMSTSGMSWMVESLFCVFFAPYVVFELTDTTRFPLDHPLAFLVNSLCYWPLIYGVCLARDMVRGMRQMKAG